MRKTNNSTLPCHALPCELYLNTLDYSKWWELISEQLVNNNEEYQLSLIFKQITTKFYNNPLLQNTRVLVTLGKDRPDIVIPIFSDALVSNNVALINTTVMEINTLSKLYFKELTPLYEQIFANTCINAQWLAILNLFNLMRIFPKQVSIFLKCLLRKKEELTIDTSKETTFFKHIRDITLTEKEFYEVFSMADDKLQWVTTLNLIDYAKKKPQGTENLFLKALRNGCDNARWSALLGIMELVKIHPQQFGPLLTKILHTYPPSPLFTRSRVLIEMSKDKNSVNRIFNILQQVTHSNNQCLKWTALAELIMIGRILPSQPTKI